MSKIKINDIEDLDPLTPEEIEDIEAARNSDDWETKTLEELLAELNE